MDDHTQLAVLDDLARDFAAWAGAFWRIHDKAGDLVTFTPNAAQERIEAAWRAQADSTQPVRLRVLKYRQAGVSLWATMRLLHATLLHEGWTSLSIADKQDLPAQWLRRCRSLVEQTRHGGLPVSTGATSANEIWFDQSNSRYYIGSAEGTTPGMGLTIRAIHCSEVASWRDPDSVLADLLPAVPPGAGTVVIQESTGRAVGDWWYHRYHEAKAGEGGYRAVFLPWWLQAEYRADPTEVIDLGPSESALVACGCDKAQLAWRRRMLRDEFHGDEALFANQFPATEDEAFLAGGLNIYTPEMVALGRGTVREPPWKGWIWPERNPREFKLEGGAGGDMLRWEEPDERYHYVLGADCQWGVKDTADFDVLDVECLETGRVCAKVKGRFPLSEWGRKIAAVGHYYNHCPVAPERNAIAADALMPLLLGNIADWRYPHVWVRTDDVKLTGHRPQDYGWLTNEHTKGELIQFSQTQTLAGGFDWADGPTVDQMASIIRREDGSIGAPEGMHDDDWMARLITGYVAHRERSRTDLWREPEPVVYEFTDMQDRIRAMASSQETPT